MALVFLHSAKIYIFSKATPLLPIKTHRRHFGCAIFFNNLKMCLFKENFETSGKRIIRLNHCEKGVNNSSRLIAEKTENINNSKKDRSKGYTSSYTGEVIDNLCLYLYLLE